MTGKEKVAWAAGLFEGEGTWIVRTGKSRYPTVQLGLAMCDRDVVERFAAIVACGHIYHFPRKGRMQRDQWRWETARRADGARIARMFLPYLGERRKARACEILAAASHTDGRRLRHTAKL